jgi:ABC-2 type transport system ATP-binding protein
MSEPVVVTDRLGKDYRAAAGWRDLARGRVRGVARTALDGVSLRVEAGEVVAIMGENGAGKSTLLKTLAGLLAPTRGSGRVAGHELARGGAGLRRAAAYVGGDARSFAWRLSVRENLEFFAALAGHAPAAARARIDAALARVGLADVAGRRAAELSTGMHKRLSLARGLLGAPRAWLLDEPTSGLDPAAARGVRTLVKELAGAGAAVVLCTHLVEDARAVAARAVVLRGGRVVYDGGVVGEGLEVALG